VNFATVLIDERRVKAEHEGHDADSSDFDMFA
jgi:hypothetical protein